MRPRLLVAVAIAAAMAPSAAGAAPIKVAIVPGIAVNVDAARVDALSQDLADALSSELEVEAVGGLEVRRRLPPEGLPPDCANQPACVADVARRLGADQLLFVVMVDSGTTGSVQVDATWIESASGQAVSRPAIDLAAGDVAKSKFAAAAHALLPDAPVRPKEKPRMSEPVPRHVTRSAMIAGGVSVVGFGLALGFGIPARSRYNACDADPDHCMQDRRDSIRHLTLAADAGLLLGVGGAIAASVLFATSSEKPHLILQPSTSGLGVAAIGRF